VEGRVRSWIKAKCVHREEFRDPLATRTLAERGLWHPPSEEGTAFSSVRPTALAQ
jgi:hypothetical protein